MTEIRLLWPQPGTAATWVVLPTKYDGYEVSPGLYAHTFTPLMLSASEATHLTRTLMHGLRPLLAQDRRQARARKRVRRAKRAAFRRRKQGRA